MHLIWRKTQLQHCLPLHVIVVAERHCFQLFSPVSFSSETEQWTWALDVSQWKSQILKNFTVLPINISPMT